MEQVADSVGSPWQPRPGNTRSNAFDILNRGGEFEHSLNLQESPLGAPRQSLKVMVAGAGLHHALS